MDVRLPVDDQNSQAWVEAARSGRYCSRLLTSVPDPAEGSRFGQVDGLYRFEKVSDRARAYLVAALEHLVMWADFAAPLKFHDEQVTDFTLRPTFTLARAAMEASAQAIWLMDSPTPAECVRRHLCLIRWDLQEFRKSKLDATDKQAVKAQEDELLQRVSAQFSPDQIAPPLGYLHVIRAACDSGALALNPNDAERLWRAASGAAHGKYWPTVELEHLFLGEEYEPGYHRALRYPDASAMTEVLRAAGTMLTYGVARFASHSGADLMALHRNAIRWLAEVQPLRPGIKRADVLRQLGLEDGPL